MMKHPFFISTLGHLIVILLLIFGLPHWFRAEPLMVSQVPIEIVDISDVTQLKKKVVKTDQKIEPIKKTEKKKTVTTGEVKQVKKETPPPKEVKEEVIKVAEKQKIENIKEPPKKEIKEPVHEEVKPKELPKNEVTEPVQKEIKKKEIKKPEPEKKENVLDALFKDLDKIKEEQTDIEKEEEEIQSFTEANRTNVDKLTLSEKDALIYQIQNNWHYVPGSFDNVPAFRVMIKVNEEGQVESVSLEDKGILSQISGRSCFESIKRAIFRSSPLILPMEKKYSWSDGVRVTVDPQQVQIY